MKAAKENSKKRGHLAKSIAKSTDLTEEAGENVVEAVFESITQALAQNQSVQIHGFGTFSTRERNNHNHVTNEPFFTPGKAFRSAVKKNQHS